MKVFKAVSILIPLTAMLLLITGCPDTGGTDLKDDPDPSQLFSINQNDGVSSTRDVILYCSVDGAVAARFSNHPFDEETEITTRGITDPPTIDEIIGEQPTINTNFVSLIEKYPDSLTNPDLVEILKDDDEAIAIIDNNPGIHSVINARPEAVSLFEMKPTLVPTLFATSERYVDLLEDNPDAITDHRDPWGNESTSVNLRGNVPGSELGDYFPTMETLADDLEVNPIFVFDIDRDEPDPMPWTGEGSETTEWLTYTDRKTWKLRVGNAPQTVYAQFRDASGNIILDTFDQI